MSDRAELSKTSGRNRLHSTQDCSASCTDLLLLQERVGVLQEKYETLERSMESTRGELMQVRVDVASLSGRTIQAVETAVNQMPGLIIQSVMRANGRRIDETEDTPGIQKGMVEFKTPVGRLRGASTSIAMIVVIAGCIWLLGRYSTELSTSVQKRPVSSQPKP